MHIFKKQEAKTTSFQAGLQYITICHMIKYKKKNENFRVNPLKVGRASSKFKVFNKYA